MKRRIGGIVLFLVSVVALSFAQTHPLLPPNLQKDLLRVHHEVRAMGIYPGENFVFQQFFTGKEDDDDTNKDVHVGVLIRPGRVADQMEIQVTRMIRNPRDRLVSTAEESRSIICRIAGETAEIIASDFQIEETVPVVKDLLKAVLQKKAIMRYAP